ncbi:MAG: sulfotransferase family protein [Bacteroidota bacterium]
MSTYLHVWSGPRNVSTALMYAFAQRTDTRVFDEPLYAAYLARTGIIHPGREDILASQAQSPDTVIDTVLNAEYDRSVVFFKQMAHHRQGLDLSRLRDARHVLLVRDPAYVLRSFAKVVEAPGLDDIGLADQWALYQDLKALGQEPLVVDGHALRQDPEGELRRMCSAVNIPFDPAMLSWEAGARPEDGVWAPYWYNRVHQSTGFAPFEPETFSLPPALEAVRVEAQAYYDSLLEQSR